MFAFFAILILAVAVNANPTHQPVANSHGPTSRIIGGESTTIQSYPHHVTIYLILQTVKATCGGSIISSHYVLTRAKCAWPWSLDRSFVDAGTSHRTDSVGSAHLIDWVRKHRNYSSNEHGLPIYDVAVLRVTTPFEFDETRQPIRLADKGVSPGIMGSITGYDSSPWPVPDRYQMQVLNLTVIDKKDCDDAYAKLGGISESQFCAANLGEGIKSPCSGGYGFVVDGKLTGVLSYVETCYEAKYPAVFTDVGLVRDWIIKMAKL